MVKDRYNWSIAISRIAATVLILLCHLFSKIGLGWIGSIFDVGVPIFLIISGFLYGGGQNRISDIKIFFWKRWCRICVTMYIWLTVVVVSYCLQKDYKVLKAVPIFLFNLQGIGWIQDFWSVPSIGDIGILWFLTIIYICYLLLPVIDYYFDKLESFWGFKILLVGIIFMLNYLGIHLSYFLSFIIGYWLGRKRILIRGKKECITLCVITLLCQVFRLLMRKFFDDTVIYNYIVVYISHTVLAYFIMVIIDNVTYLVEKANRFSGFFQYVIRQVDSLSIYIYIVHYTFLTGVLAVNKIIHSYIFWIPLWIAQTIIGAIILKKLSDCVLNNDLICKFEHYKK